MNKLTNFFEKYGIEQKDIPKSLLLFKGLTYGASFVTLAACYRYKPIRTLCKQPGPQRFFNNVKKKYPEKYTSYNNFMKKKTEQLANWKIFKPIPKTLGLKSKDFAAALGENIIFYKLTCPITLPFNFWLTTYLMRSKSDEEITFDKVVDDSYEVYWVEEE